MPRIWHNNRVAELLLSVICLYDRDANEARRGRGRGQEHEAETNSHEAETKAEVKIWLIFSAEFYILTPFSPKMKVSVDFRRDFKHFSSKRALLWELYQ